jgi:thioredoxin 1
MKVIKMSIVGFVFFLLIIATPSNAKYQADEVKPFVAEFIRIGKLFNVDKIEKRTKEISIRFGDTSEKELANCSYSYKEITINKKYWKKLSVENKEEVVFHELGHCVLNVKVHTETGIMKAIGLHDSLEYRYNYEFLINQFFNCKQFNCVEILWDENKYKSSKEYKVTKADLLNNEHAVARFTASWCPPCKALAPVFDEVAAAHPDVKVYVIDVDQNPDLATDMGVKGIPCMIEIKNSKVDTVLVGNQPKPEIEKLFK